MLELADLSVFGIPPISVAAATRMDGAEWFNMNPRAVLERRENLSGSERSR